MSTVVVLEEVKLVPVVWLAPAMFATQTRPLPSCSRWEAPEAWHRYWSDSLADSGFTGLTPVQQGSWHVPTAEFTDPDCLRRLLAVILCEEDGVDCLHDPDCVSALFGGLALCGESPEVLIEPQCCVDLGNVADWREIVGYSEPCWQMLWIGHPWISVRFEAPRLIISDPHESESPTGRCAVSPDQLARALAAAEIELERFAERIASVLPSLGYRGDSSVMSQKLAGLDK